ncbi:MAG: ATP-dependent DNA helicase [Parcubacteria group bacterium GW2011_GWD2_42_14]|nr:MAG: ATP-dependent DNA helicase [Parcubacteria group bacterium GW2011_GWD2_42_14]
MPPLNSITQLSSQILESEAFINRFLQLQTYAGQSRLSFDITDLSDAVVSKLLFQGSVLAMSDDVPHKKVSQKINALLFETKADQPLVNLSIQILSSRLGNYPVISEDSEVFGEQNIVRKLNDGADVIEVLDPEILGSLSFEEEQARLLINNQVFHFNLYQKEILDELADKALVSFSAPTSFGKSFIVRHHLAREYAEGRTSKVLIIVPTKSLIDDFHESVSSLKRRLGLDFSIYTHARSVEEVPERSVFILTQERLSFLIEKNPDFVRTFQIVYCDEAQYISRGYRGFVLRSVLRRVIDLCGILGVNGNTQYIFSSPLIKNPEYYKERFFPELTEDHFFHKEVLYSPVEKNIHFVTKGSVDFSYSLLNDSSNQEGFAEKIQELGNRTFPQQLRGNNNSVEKEIERNIHVVLNSNLGSGTILYTTSPLKTHEYAHKLAEILPEKNILNQREILDITQYIRDHYDESFGLIDLIRRGIGLHYGRMPIGLRRAMVRLFENRTIDYLVCTSTLLEGVNLPAKNIFLFSNKHNGNTKHTALSFWNLVGRAGRITFGLSGNIFCVTQRMEEFRELFEKQDSEIVDPETEVSDNQTRRNYVLSSFLDQEKRFDYLRSRSRSDIEYLIYELLTVNNIEEIVNRFKLPEEERVSLMQSIQIEKDSLQLPVNVLRKNPGIDPRLQDSLLTLLEGLTQLQLRTLCEIAANPLAVNKLSLKHILEKTGETLQWPQNGQFDEVDTTAGRISQWLHELSIAQFIQQALRHHQDATPIERVEKALRVVDRLDKDLSYNAPKYIKCFYDLVLYDAQRRGMQDLDTYEERIESFLFSIESGVSSFIGRFLFERGVSRPIAIKTNFLVEELAGGPVNLTFFEREDVVRALSEGLSRIAFDELMEHLNA